MLSKKKEKLQISSFFCYTTNQIKGIEIVFYICYTNLGTRKALLAVRTKRFAALQRRNMRFMNLDPDTAINGARITADRREPL